MQSAYHANHSTETSLLKVKTDILHLINKQNVVCVCMLDLSAAFNTISHSKLLAHLHYRFGIMGTSLKWIESYLQNRTQSVVLPDEKGGSTKSGKYPLNQRMQKLQRNGEFSEHVLPRSIKIIEVHV